MNECKLYSLMATGRNVTYLYVQKTTGQLLLVSRPGGLLGNVLLLSQHTGIDVKKFIYKNDLKLFVSRKKKGGTQFKRLG